MKKLHSQYGFNTLAVHAGTVLIRQQVRDLFQYIKLPHMFSMMQTMQLRFSTCRHQDLFILV